jgi:hypothetical protein
MIVVCGDGGLPTAEHLCRNGKPLSIGRKTRPAGPKAHIGHDPAVQTALMRSSGKQTACVSR